MIMAFIKSVVKSSAEQYYLYVAGLNLVDRLRPSLKQLIFDTSASDLH